MPESDPRQSEVLRLEKEVADLTQARDALAAELAGLHGVEQALRRNEAFLAEAERLSSTGTFLWFLDNNEMTFSEELYRIHEIDPGLPMSSELHLSRTHPDDVQLIHDTAARFGRERGPITYESRLQMPDGRIKYVRTFGRVLRDPEGRLACLGVCQDITERRLAEEALAKVRSELEHATRAMSLGVLTASIAHEVNQPLAGILTNANTCVRMLSLDPPNLEGALATAHRTIRDSKRATEVIGRLRTLFSHKSEVFEPVDLNDAVREVVELAKSQLQRNRVALSTDFDETIAPAMGDRVQLQQVILNLILNASEAMSSIEDRPRTIAIRTRSNAERGAVDLAVSDTGVGLASHDLEKPFDPFYTTKPTGMGIGLAVSRQIVERHQGRLWASQNDGPGATFAFSIPFKQAGGSGSFRLRQGGATEGAPPALGR